MCIVSILSAVLTISKSDMFTMLCLVLGIVLVALLVVLAWVLYSANQTSDYEDASMAQVYSPYNTYPQLERTWTIEEAREKLPLIMTPQMQREMGMNTTSRLDIGMVQQRAGAFRVIRTIEMTHADEVV